jgi:hypothetical protein
VTRKRTDLDKLAYELRAEGLTYRAIAKWLGVTPRHGPASGSSA